MNAAAYAFIRELAADDPITCDFGDGELNACKFCGVAWATEVFANALKPKDRSGYGCNPHEPDCLWVRANQIVQELDAS